MAYLCRGYLTAPILILGFLTFAGAVVPLASNRVQGAQTIPNCEGQSESLQHAGTQACNISVGFSLQSSYASVAVIFDRADGTKDTVVRTLDGGYPYRKVMAYLSRQSSQHLAPPYGLMDQYFLDLPRVLFRRALKRIGLPASFEVGILGDMVRKLRISIESEFGIQITNAVLSVTHLVAFYEDDGEDVCEYAGIEHIRPQIYLAPPVWETSAAYAGYGFGLCEHFRDATTCRLENQDIPERKIMAVHYSRSALQVTLPTLYEANHLYESPYERRNRFDLGSDAIGSYPSAEQYWKEVNSSLLEVLGSNPYIPRPQFIIVTGDHNIHGDFMEHLEQAMEGSLGFVPPIYSDDAATVAAKGAAEIRRRASYRERHPWEKWSDLRCPHGQERSECGSEWRHILPTFISAYLNTAFLPLRMDWCLHRVIADFGHVFVQLSHYFLRSLRICRVVWDR